MDLSLGVLIVAFALTAAMVKMLQPVAYWLELVDKPGGRKRHEGLIPLIGGISIFIGTFLTGYVFLEQPTFIRLFMIGGGFIVFLGAIDDRYDISARLRLVGQVLVAAIFVYGLNIYLANFGDLLGIGDIRVGWLGYPLAILSLVGVINAFNMLDGVDGLIGSLSVVTLLGLFVLFAGAGHQNIATLCIIYIGGLLAFLIFNIWGKPSKDRTLAKVFMGDAGSMLLGLAIGVLLISGSQGENVAFKPAAAIWFVLFPMTDMFTLMYRRLKRGKSPVAPDRTHIHHIFMRAGLKPMQCLAVLVGVQSILVVIGIVVARSDAADVQVMSMMGVVVFVMSYQLLMRRSWRFVRWSRRRFINGATRSV